MTHAASTPRLSGASRAVVAVAAVVTAIFIAVTTAVPAEAVPVSQELVVLTRSHVAYTAPDTGSRVVTNIAGKRPLTGDPTSLPVVGHAAGSTGLPWLQVRLSGRPRQPVAWIRASYTKSKTTPWRLKVDLSSRRVTVYLNGGIVRIFPAIVGSPSTPTPTGEFFIEETMSLSGAHTGGPYALATSARSAVYQEFMGGPGQIAIHGMGNLSGQMGTAISHGCIRLSYVPITWLARRVGGGVPLTIQR